MRHKILELILIVLILLTIVWIAFCGYQWSWGPFEKLHDLKTKHHPGNASDYALNTVSKEKSSTLANKQILFLGSSVTYGAASQGVSFADYLSAKTGCISVKDAVSGTTLVDNGGNSYIKRLNKQTTSNIDLLVCQLSTNDATQKKELGAISSSKDIEDFDTNTIAGAIEYIIAYSQDKWDCPVMFYTNSHYDSAEYDKMVKLLYQLQDKWEIGIIDLWNNDDFNQITDEQRTLYMADSIHPTKAGYLEWWLPTMETSIIEYLKVE